MAGLIQDKLSSNPQEFAPGDNNQSATTMQSTTATPGYDPERIELDPKIDTVEGRVEGIIAKNSPLMQSAATRAAQQSNRRGLLNSSMAVGAGQRAVIDAAMPIASQDAQTSFQTKGLNQQAGNEARQLGANMEFTTGRDAALHQQQLERDTLQGEQEQALQQLRGEQSVQLSQIENEYGNLRRASESAASFYNQTANAIGNILANPDMTQGAKDALIKKQLDLLKGGLNVIGGISNLDLTGLLDFGGNPSDGTDGAEPPTGWVPNDTSIPGINIDDILNSEGGYSG